MTEKAAASRRRFQRRRTAKPRNGPIFPPCPEWPLDELAVAAEGDWPFQLLLWQRARDVELWAATPRAHHRSLFVEPVLKWQELAEVETGETGPIAGPVRVLSAMIRYPEVAQATDVCAACIAISEWAVSNHLPKTALRFAEAAAQANPADARAAAHAGQMAAREAADSRAEVWYERGIKIGRRMEDWEWYIRSNIRLGILRYEQGKFRAALMCYGRARSRALWAGLPAFVGKAHHDMMLIYLAIGSFAAADRHARGALDYYPLHYERLPHLAQDYAVVLTTYRYDAEALRVLDLALPLVTLPEERIALLGTMAKAAAGVGNHRLYRRAVEDVQLLASVSEVNAAGALALGAEGAVAVRDWSRADGLASLALEIATRRREREPRRRAELVLRSVWARRVLPRPSPRQDPERAAETTALFLTRLSQLGGSTTDAGAHSRGRTELTKFSIAGR